MIIQVSYSFSFDGHLGCLQFLVTMNFVIHVFLFTYVSISIGYIPRDKIMGQRAMHMFTLHRYKYFLQNGSFILHSHKHMFLFCFLFLLDLRDIKWISHYPWFMMHSGLCKALSLIANYLIIINKFIYLINHSVCN